MIELELKGCRPQPLMSYLKALGILRLVSMQIDGDEPITACWRNECFYIYSPLDERGLMYFFLNEYKPTPVVVPWSGSDFFSVSESQRQLCYKKTPTSSEIISAFLMTTSDRLEDYRAVIRKVLETIKLNGITQAKIKSTGGKEEKIRFLSLLRSQLPENALPWIDMSAVITNKDLTFNTIVGSGGGNDGNTHFSDNFMQNLWDCLPDFGSQRASNRGRQGFDSLRALEEALHGVSNGQLVSKRTASVFDSGAVGGPNATQGMERDSLTNPWDFVLAIEGVMCFRAAVVRRQQVSNISRAAFPFTASMVAAGYGSAVQGESRDREIWLPLWNRPLGFRELEQVFSEARAQFGKRNARDGATFALAVSSLGVDRGIRRFTRYGIVKGRVGGKNYHTAVPLGRYEVKQEPNVDLLHDLQQSNWLDRYRSACNRSNPEPPPRFLSALRKLDAAIMDYCRYGTTPLFRAIFRALGKIERELALIPGRPIGAREVRPIPSLSSKWISACDDGSPEFRIAVALASVKGNVAVGPMSAHLEQTDRGQKYTRWLSTKTGQEVWGSTGLCHNMIGVLQRRLMDAARSSIKGIPLEADCPVSLEDVTAFLNGHTDDNKIEEYLWSAILVRNPSVPGSDRVPKATLSPPVSRAYCMLKLLFLPAVSALRTDADGEPIRAEPTILTHLRAGNTPKALAVAARRLRVSGHIPMPGPQAGGKTRPPEFTEAVRPERLGAALLIPLWARDTQELVRTILRRKSE